MRILSFALLCLYMLGGVLSQSSSLTSLEIFQTSFQDPASDSMLKIDVKNPCVSQIQVTVHIPTSSSGESNAHFVGSPFNDIVVHGTSTHKPFGLPVSVSTSVHVSWNGQNLTFSHFIAGQATAASSKNGTNGGDIWWSINFDITGLFITQIPLNLELNTDVPNTDTPFINLAQLKHFSAEATNDTCLDGTIQGDPVFAGFQGQNFQFHGLPDEHFNLVSSPDVQLNSHFVYLSSGTCDYTDTPCFTHAGTYMDALGLSVADAHVKVVAGTHAAGLRVWVNDEELRRGAHMRHMTNNVTTSALTYHHNGKLEIHTDILRLEIVNSDMFFNIRVGLNDKELLRVGATHHTVTDHAICKTNTETSNHQLVERTVAKKYNVTTPLHGLIGQTWRNVQVCGRDWMGTVEDYVVSDLFASDSHYSYFNW